MKADPNLAVLLFPGDMIAFLSPIVTSLASIFPVRSSLVNDDPPKEVSFRALHFGVPGLCAGCWIDAECASQVRNTAEMNPGLVSGLPSICPLPNDVFLILLIEYLTYGISCRSCCRPAQRGCFKSGKSIQCPVSMLALEPLTKDLGGPTAPCGTQSRRDFLAPLQPSPFRR